MKGSTMPLEVEMKFPVADREAVRRQLAALGARAESVETQVDTYLRHPSRSFAETDEALRVRQIGSRVRVTYKGPKLDRTTKTRVEVELEFAPATTPADVLQFWRHLSFEPVREVRKERETLAVTWQGREVEACLDRVAGLGEFLEFEISAESEQLEESRQVLKSLAASLQLGESERRSYLELLLEKQAAAADTPEKAEDWSE
jgi:adenylate cyclase class 2